MSVIVLHLQTTTVVCTIFDDGGGGFLIVVQGLTIKRFLKRWGAEPRDNPDASLNQKRSYLRDCVSLRQEFLSTFDALLFGIRAL